jgi:hypothetical protein
MDAEALDVPDGSFDAVERFNIPGEFVVVRGDRD